MADGVLTLANPLTLQGGTLRVQGGFEFTQPVSMNADTTLNLGDSSMQVVFDQFFSGVGILTVNGPGAVVFGGGFGSGLTLAGQAVVDVSGNFGLTDALTLDNGTHLDVQGHFTADGEIDDSGSLTVAPNGSLYVQGVFMVEPGGLFDDEGSSTVEQDGMIDDYGTVTLGQTLVDSGTVRVEPDATLNNPDAVLTQGTGVLITAAPGYEEYPTITVNSVKDYAFPRGNKDNLLTLREAVELLDGTLLPSDLTEAQKAQITNGTPGEGPMNVIAFDIPESDTDAITGDDVSNVDPTSGVDTIHLGSHLPDINHPVDLDGYTQPGAEPATDGSPAALKIELDGSGAGAGEDGLLTLQAGGCLVRGLVINRFQPEGQWNGFGIVLLGAGDNTIQGNYLGTDAAGEEALGNASAIDLLSAHNTIGGPRPEDRNIISGNAAFNGIQLGGTEYYSGTQYWGVVPGVDGNVIQGNYIGLNAEGDAALPNACGIYIWDGASDNVIGGPRPGDGNVISGNTYNGIWMDVTSGDGNVVRGNSIGTDRTGTAALGNGLEGIGINGGSHEWIGGPDAADGNVISGNGRQGVLIWGPGPTDVTVQNNNIGTDESGTVGLGNGLQGVSVIDAAANHVLDNLISANGGVGLQIRGIQASGNEVRGNWIGTDRTGHEPLGNGQDGVTIVNAPNNILAGQNVIAGNGVYGVYITGATAIGNSVENNLIGTTAEGTAALPNDKDGVRIDGSPGNTIGGGNVISGNLRYGVAISGPGATANLIAGNLIGTDSSGLQPLGNQIGVYIDDVPGNTVGGSGVDARNIISGNNDTGVCITGPSAQGDVVQGNWIGLGKDGGTKLGNAVDGVRIDQSASGDSIGGADLVPGHRARQRHLQ